MFDTLVIFLKGFFSEKMILKKERKSTDAKSMKITQHALIVGEPEIQKLEKSGRKVAEF